MTRVNVINVYELSDQHLIAEYRELPRCVKQNISIVNAPSLYCLGKGHMKFCRCHILFLLDRYNKICEELLYRGFKISYMAQDLIQWAKDNINNYHILKNYVPRDEDIALNKNRLIEKYRLKPNFYKWTKREKPDYYTIL